MGVKFDFKGYGTADFTMSRDNFIYQALQSRDFRIDYTEYELVVNEGEGFGVLISGEHADLHMTSLSMLIDYLGKIYDINVKLSLEEIKDIMYTLEDKCDRVMLASLMCTIGYINCQIAVGLEPTELELDNYVQQIKDIG